MPVSQFLPGRTWVNCSRQHRSFSTHPSTVGISPIRFLLSSFFSISFPLICCLINPAPFLCVVSSLDISVLTFRCSKVQGPFTLQSWSSSQLSACAAVIHSYNVSWKYLKGKMQRSQTKCTPFLSHAAHCNTAGYGTLPLSPHTAWTTGCSSPASWKKNTTHPASLEKKERKTWRKPKHSYRSVIVPLRMRQSQVNHRKIAWSVCVHCMP